MKKQLVPSVLAVAGLFACGPGPGDSEAVATIALATTLPAAVGPIEVELPALGIHGSLAGGAGAATCGDPDAFTVEVPATLDHRYEAKAANGLVWAGSLRGQPDACTVEALSLWNSSSSWTVVLATSDADVPLRIARQEGEEIAVTSPIDPAELPADLFDEISDVRKRELADWLEARIADGSAALVVGTPAVWSVTNAQGHARLFAHSVEGPAGVPVHRGVVLGRDLTPIPAP